MEQLFAMHVSIVVLRILCVLRERLPRDDFSLQVCLPVQPLHPHPTRQSETKSVTAIMIYLRNITALSICYDNTHTVHIKVSLNRCLEKEMESSSPPVDAHQSSLRTVSVPQHSSAKRVARLGMGVLDVLHETC